MANVNFAAPSDYTSEAADIERLRKYAEMLQQQGLQPIASPQTPAGGFTPGISWTQGLAQMLKAYSGRKGMEDAAAAQKALAERYNVERGQALAEAMRAGIGTPASTETIVDEQAMGGEGQMAQINAPAVAGSRQAMIAKLTGSKFPDLQQAGMAQVFKDAEPYTLAAGAQRIGPGGQVIATNVKPQEGFTLTPGGSRFDATGKPIASLPEKAPKDEGAWSEPYNLGGAWVQRNETTGQVRQAVAREPQVRVHQEAPITAVTLADPKDPNKTIVIDGRSGRVLGAGPKLTQAGQMETKRQFNMQGIGQTIKDAEDLLSGAATGTQPTNSGVGAAVDFAGRLVGKSPKGAKEAAALEAVGGALVTKMPRMEGPQSDKDVALYKEMAAKVGDRTVPIGERQLALNKVKDLWAKYERLNPDAFVDRRAGGDEPPPGAVRPRNR